MPRTKKIKEEDLPAQAGKTDKVVVKKTSIEQEFYHAVGRRKEATARVKLFVVTNGKVVVKDRDLKKGETLINYKPIEQYFPGEVYAKLYLEPFRTTNTVGRFAVSAIISGGGPSGQLGAFIHGVSRALEKVDKDKFRSILKKKGFMTRDPRAKERRKAGLAQKARAKKQSPKR